MNLLDETVADLKEYGYTPKNVIAVGDLDEGYSTWDDFALRAKKINYDNRYGAVEINPDLTIWLDDGRFFERQEYNGSELWWRRSTCVPILPEKGKYNILYKEEE